MEAARRMRGAALAAALVSALSTLLLVANLGMPSRSWDSSYYDERSSSSLRRNRRVLNLDAFADPKSVEGRSQESQDASNILSQMKAFEEQRGITRGAGDSSYDPTMTLSSGSGINVGNLQAGAEKQLDEMQMMQQGQSSAADGLLYQPIKFEERPVSRNVLGTIYAPTLHDKNFSLYEQDYRSAIEDWVVMMHGAGQPLLHSFEYIPTETETYYAVWGWQRGRIEGSAWRVGGSQAEYLDVYSYVDPRGYDLESAPVLTVDGDHAAFHGWHPAAYGHVLDYHLSQVAFLKSQVHDECRFLFVEGSLKDILLYIDPAFYERVTWLKKGQIAKINGNLLMGFHEVSARKEFPRVWGKWLASKLARNLAIPCPEGFS
ncbi:hypothetical protein THAOC_00694 [Thalassiosira oceanica]|uniref:Uncharacterized protein n=1 Tax=Thalassiosira oceanica TaxID=159749 RepID=K0TJU4_THAOC|nr:hypothetical protein THAOC_00694 [Thalassiosira oceanica]|eukprot:EJK77474.1 hypothetical protein THAOC_00694 [Thalassiosira oceanica]